MLPHPGGLAFHKVTVVAVAENMFSDSVAVEFSAIPQNEATKFTGAVVLHTDLEENYMHSPRLQITGSFQHLYIIINGVGRHFHL